MQELLREMGTNPIAIIFGWVFALTMLALIVLCIAVRKGKECNWPEKHCGNCANNVEPMPDECLECCKYHPAVPCWKGIK